MKRKPKVGETLIQTSLEHGRHGPVTLTPVTVMNVGRKYFTCCPPGKGDYWDVKYHIDTWREVSKYSSRHWLYESEQEYADEREAGQLQADLRQYFSHWGPPKMSLADLRAVKAIVDKYEKPWEPKKTA